MHTNSIEDSSVKEDLDAMKSLRLDNIEIHVDKELSDEDPFASSQRAANHKFGMHKGSAENLSQS
jgi:hypothetical protein